MNMKTVWPDLSRHNLALWLHDAASRDGARVWVALPIDPAQPVREVAPDAAKRFGVEVHRTPDGGIRQVVWRRGPGEENPGAGMILAVFPGASLRERSALQIAPRLSLRPDEGVHPHWLWRVPLAGGDERVLRARPAGDEGVSLALAALTEEEGARYGSAPVLCDAPSGQVVLQREPGAGGYWIADAQAFAQLPVAQQQRLRSERIDIPAPELAAQTPAELDLDDPFGDSLTDGMALTEGAQDEHGEEVGEHSEQDADPPPAPAKTRSARSAGKRADFGEKIGGARKDATAHLRDERDRVIRDALNAAESATPAAGWFGGSSDIRARTQAVRRDLVWPAWDAARVNAWRAAGADPLGVLFGAWMRQATMRHPVENVKRKHWINKTDYLVRIQIFTAGIELVRNRFEDALTADWTALLGRARQKASEIPRLAVRYAPMSSVEAMAECLGKEIAQADTMRFWHAMLQSTGYGWTNQAVNAASLRDSLFWPVNLLRKTAQPDDLLRIDDFVARWKAATSLVPHLVSGQSYQEFRRERNDKVAALVSTALDGGSFVLLGMIAGAGQGPHELWPHVLLPALMRHRDAHPGTVPPWAEGIISPDESLDEWARTHDQGAHEAMMLRFMAHSLRTYLEQHPGRVQASWDAVHAQLGFATGPDGQAQDPPKRAPRAKQQSAGEAGPQAASAAGENRDTAAEESPPPVWIQKTPAPRYEGLRREGPRRRPAPPGFDPDDPSAPARDVTEQELCGTFGFRAVEYGLWANQSERQDMLNMAFDSCADIAESLGLPWRFMSLSGTLAMAFGARGKGGKAAAHYEPGLAVINFTKTSGAGWFAHEWSHALDHWVFQKASGVPLQMASEAQLPPTDSAKETPIRAAARVIHQLVNLCFVAADLRDEAILAEYNRGQGEPFHINAIWKEEEGAFALGTKTRIVRAVLEQTDLLEDWSRCATQLLAEYPDLEGCDPPRDWQHARGLLAERIAALGLSAAFRQTHRGAWQYNHETACASLSSVLDEWRAGHPSPHADPGKARLLREISDQALEIAIGYTGFRKALWSGPRSLEKKIGSDGRTRFLRNARMLDANRKLYWSSRVELFARLFSAVIHDRMTEAGIRNDFASRGSAPNEFSAAEYRGNPNPEGVERKAFGLVATALIAALQAQAAPGESPEADEDGEADGSDTRISAA